MGGHGVRVEKEDEDRKKWRRGKEEVEEEVKRTGGTFSSFSREIIQASRVPLFLRKWSLTVLEGTCPMQLA